jgi:hypothetical protein
MTEQSTNGPVSDAAFDAGVLERGAQLSAQMAQPQLAVEITPERTARELRARLELINEVKRTAMANGVDFGLVPGTDKPTLFKPGAEKLAIVFKLDVQPSNELIWGPGEHLTVISRATVYHTPTGARLGYGEGICSSRERSRAYRKQERNCPDCEAPAVIKGKQEFGGGYVCWGKKGGCGAKFPDGDQRIESQEVGQVENPDLPDTWNAVDKMAKKRGYVDAVLSVTGASAIFTQDIGADPTETGADPGPEHGPVVAGELKHAATHAAITLCAGDLGEAETLWQRIQVRLDGYMPEAAATALVIAAENVVRSGESHQAAGEAIAAAGTEPAEAPANAQAAGEQAAPVAGADTPAEAQASARGADQPPNSRTVPQPNPHGAQLRVIATARGVSDAELANLIRNAVAQGPIPAERARTALPEMLARITEEIAARTTELVEMFYPPANAPSNGAPADATSVDFAAVEPPRAA